MSDDYNWRKQVYDHYISSGQAPLAASKTARNLFASRAPYVNWLIKTHIPPTKDITIVDLGCGHGTYVYFLKQHGYEDVRGVDISIEQVEYAHELGLETVIHSDLLNFLEGCDDASIDVILMIDILEHMDRESVFSILNRVHRVLRQGGICIGHVPNAAGIFGIQVRYNDITHELAFTDRSIKQIFNTLGFQHVQAYEESPLIYNLKSLFRWIIWATGTLPYRLLKLAESGSYHIILSSNLIFKARK